MFAELYTVSAALMAANFYEDASPTSKYRATPAEAGNPARYAELSKHIFEGPQSPSNKLAASMHSMVFDAARDTVSSNAKAEGVPIVREEEAGACGDCRQRATLVAKDRNSSSDGVSWERHTRCEFLFVPVRRGLYSPPEYARQWREQIHAARLAGNENPEDIAKYLEGH